MYYYGARYYNPLFGRFTQADPLPWDDSTIKAAGGKGIKEFLLNPQHFNRYSYGNNNPLRYIDPTGLYKYETSNWGMAFLHESNIFNANSAMRQQINSWSLFYKGDFSGAARLSGQAILDTNGIKIGSDWQYAYTSFQINTAQAVGLAFGANLFNAGLRSVFYAGEEALAAALANKGSGIILGETVGGAFLNRIENLIVNMSGKSDFNLPRFIWDAASAIFAANAKGTIQTFLRNPTQTSTFLRVEEPILRFLGNITDWMRQ